MNSQEYEKIQICPKLSSALFILLQVDLHVHRRSHCSESHNAESFFLFVCFLRLLYIFYKKYRQKGVLSGSNLFCTIHIPNTLVNL